jgi:hypothetical protein
MPDGPVADVARRATHLGERLIVAMRTKFVFSEIAVVAQDSAKGGAKKPAKSGAKKPAKKKVATKGTRRRGKK